MAGDNLHKSVLDALFMLAEIRQTSKKENAVIYQLLTSIYREHSSINHQISSNKPEIMQFKKKKKNSSKGWTHDLQKRNLHQIKYPDSSLS